MSEIESESKRQKSKEEYSRNVKKLKVKLSTVQNEIATLEKKIDSLTNTSNDKLISMKIVKFCKERRFTPEMLFRFADRTSSKTVSKIDFRETLTQLGLKFSKDEFLRLQYMIDQDLSGEISYEEYNGYLDAFGIKKQFSQTDQLARDALQKLEIDKVLKIAEENSQDNNRSKLKKHSNLLNYEQFIKYCHKHFPNLKNKELASIFNRLEKNQLINLQDLIDYLENQVAEKKRLEEKNKKKPLKRQESLINSFVNGDRSLKSIIKALFKCRLKESTIIFHSLEFCRLQKILNTKRGELLKLFQEIDQKRRGTFRGSFTHNELINYYIQKCDKKEDLPFAFELMGNKLKVLNQSPQAVISQYATHPSEYLTEQQLKKFFESEFDVILKQYTIVSNLIPRQVNGKYEIEKIIELLKYQDGKRIVYIKPNFTSNKLVFRTGLAALKCCLQIEDKLIKMKQQAWNDYEFGPTEGDQFGAQSINLPMPSEEIDWFRTEQLGMNEFFEENLGTTYSCSSTCPNETFTKTLFSMITCNFSLLGNTTKNVDNATKDIEEQHLTYIFKGIYPLAFHSFAKYGIYVIKLFIKEKWRYVVIDNKIPCTPDKTPFFSSVANKRYSFMSIIEKAYAKALGNYEHIYSANHPNKYIVEIANILPVEYALHEKLPKSYINLLWQNMMKFQKNELKIFKENKNKQKQRFYYGMMRLRAEGLGKDIPLNIPIKIDEVFELIDNKCKNNHKSHRLMLLRVTESLKEESSWNKSWNREDAGNKYSQMNMQIADKLAEASILKSKSIVLLNYKLFRSIMSLFRFEPINFTTMIILRKQLQFEQKHKCRYEITAKSQLQVVVILTQRSNLTGARIGLDVKSQKEEELFHESHREEIVVSSFAVEKSQTIFLDLFVENWKSDTEYNYTLTLYMKHPRYELKQRDRHLLFRFVSPYEEEQKLVFSDFQSNERRFIYHNFYKAAERRGCCG